MLACKGPGTASPSGVSPVVSALPGDAGAHLPLAPVADVPLPGGATRFDYEDVDLSLGHLVLAHMNDASVLFVNVADGSVLAEVKNIPTARGVVVAADVGLVFVTSSPNEVVILDGKAMKETKRVTTGNGPDGIAWDPAHKTVGVSDQRDGALSLLANSGSGSRTQVPLGTETGNVIYDPARGWFWITVVRTSPPDQLVAVDPVTSKVATSIPLPGCTGAHGLRLHPDGRSALVACEDNDALARVDLDGAHAISLGATGHAPDVLAIDPGLGWLYVAAESGDVTVFDLGRAGVALLGHEHPGSHAHSVAVDPATHRVFFPLMTGVNGRPTLRIMRPSE
jgi:DNA-binding beta-propeller fold protein YncE